jgi:hypothetical protein
VPLDGGHVSLVRHPAVVELLRTTLATPASA